MALPGGSTGEEEDDGCPADECLDGGERGWGPGILGVAHLLMLVATGTTRGVGSG